MKIVCTAKIANTTVGHIDHALAYAVGLKELGHDVYLMEHVGSNRCVDENNNRVPFENWSGVKHFEQVAKNYGLWPNCSLIYKQGESSHGIPFSDAVKIAKQSDLLITRSGQINKVPDIFENVGCKVYIDGNPGDTQIKMQDRNEDFDALKCYQHLFTMGLNIGRSECPIPIGTNLWQSILRPVVLSMWPQREYGTGKAYTTISTWKGRGTFSLMGTYSGEKSDNWFKFMELPRITGKEFSIALRLDSTNYQADQQAFLDKGWLLSDPQQLRNFTDYKNYICNSRAEFSVAHNRYVEFVTGWFSDRSPLYLAAGKPVVIQSTGIEQHLPVGKGLLTFRTLEEAAEKIAEIEGDYQAHAMAAREIANNFFDSKKVLINMLNKIGC